MLIYCTLVTIVTVHGYVNRILKRDVAGVSYTHTVKVPYAQNGNSACYFLDIHDISLSTPLMIGEFGLPPPLRAGSSPFSSSAYRPLTKTNGL